jgi:TonB family protein
MQQAASHATALAIPAREEPGPAVSCTAGVPELLASVAIRPPATDRADRWVWAAALSLALMVHAAMLFALAHRPTDFMAGGGGQLIDAISVTMVSSDVLESRELERTRPVPAATAASVESTDGAPESTAAAAAEQREEKKERPEELKEKPKEEPIREAEAIIEMPQEPQQQQKKQESAAPATGGDAARSDTASNAKASAPAAASPGAMREYARYVAQALAKTKPKGTGGLGTVLVRFAIAGDGGLAAVEVAKSSGSPKLDNVALGAVRRTKFLTPPAGMTTAQLTYEVPYNFR